MLPSAITVVAFGIGHCIGNTVPVEYLLPNLTFTLEAVRHLITRNSCIIPRPVDC